MSYIDREKLLRNFDIRRKNTIAECPLDKELIQILNKFFYKEISLASDEDVAPIKHGKWVKIPVEDHWDIKCSDCHRLKRPVSANLLYCPNCGAKMDLEGENV